MEDGKLSWAMGLSGMWLVCVWAQRSSVSVPWPGRGGDMDLKILSCEPLGGCGLAPACFVT